MRVGMRGVTIGRRCCPTAIPTGDFFICDVLDAIPKDDMASMEHPIFSLSTRPDHRILGYHHNGLSVEITPSLRGLATIHDKDIMIYCISQLIAKMNDGHATSKGAAPDRLRPAGLDQPRDQR